MQAISNFTKNLVPTESVHSYKLPLEESHSPIESAEWMEEHWTVSLWLVTAYIILIALGVRYMRDRPKFLLRRTMFVWNLCLCCGYTFGMVRIYPELIKFGPFRDGGWHSWVCQKCPHGCTRAGSFWLWMFVLMKAPELLDTAFVVFRKQPLFFLHWYHHCTVLVFTWYLYGHQSTVGVVYALVNGVVHSLMYFYYTLKSLSIRIPRKISMALTIIQLSQMAVGCYANYYVYHVKKNGIHCSVGDTGIKASFAIYISYFCLFTWYFYKAYVVKDELIMKKMRGQKIE